MAKTPSAIQADPFRFGWRYVQPPDGNGAEMVQVPLTPDDVLHPLKGDEIPENTLHSNDRAYLFSVLRMRLADRAGCLVLSDCLVNWGIRGLREHSPDIAVFDNVADTERNRSVLAVAQEGARPVLVIEIVSVHDDTPRMRDNDVAIKVRHYYRAGVPLYVIVDQEEEGGPRRLVAYRRGRRQFATLPLDNQGRVPLEPVGLLLGLRNDRAICFDAATGEEIPDLTGMAQARDAEALARQQAEAALAAAQARIQQLEAQARARRRRPLRGPNS